MEKNIQDKGNKVGLSISANPAKGDKGKAKKEKELTSLIKKKKNK